MKKRHTVVSNHIFPCNANHALHVLHEMQYTHKYYLPLDLRNKLTPYDMVGIIDCFSGYAESNAMGKRPSVVPNKVSNCVIHNKDLDIPKKHIKGKTVRRVLDAYSAYLRDCWAALTPCEAQAALNLNAWLIDWEKQLLTQCIQLGESLERKLRSDDLWLTSYHFSTTVEFCLRSDDPYMPDDWDGDVIDRYFLCEQLYIIGFPASTLQAAQEVYRGIGDSHDYNDLREHGDNPIYKVRHCKTFHELYHRMRIPMKAMGRIGRIDSRINVEQTNNIEIDLAGERAIVAREKPRFNEAFNGIL